MDAFEAYKEFLALHNHFYRKSYDYVKYNGKVKTSYENFLKRKDRFHFHKLSKKEDVKNHVISNIVASNQKVWIVDILDESADETFKKWRKRNQSLSYSFKEELTKLGENFDACLLSKDGQHSHLLKQYMSGDISAETLIIIDSLTDVFSYWNNRFEDKIVWPEIHQKLSKYKTFLSFEKNKYKKILVDKFSEK